MKPSIKTLILAATLLGATTSASAHRIWILPSTFTLSGESERVTLDGAISNDLFFPNHVAMNLNGVTATAPDGTDVPLLHANTGEIRSTFDLKLTQQGTHSVTENAKTYFARWTENGIEKRTRGSLEDLLRKGISEKEKAAFMVAERRVQTFITLGAPTDQIFQTTKDGLELASGTHPNDIYSNESVNFSFTLDGAPAKGVEVLILKGNDRYRDAQDAVKLTTDDLGTIRFTPDTAGRYWLNMATVSGEEVEQGAKLARRVSYTVIFEALQN